MTKASVQTGINVRELVAIYRQYRDGVLTYDQVIEQTRPDRSGKGASEKTTDASRQKSSKQ